MLNRLRNKQLHVKKTGVAYRHAPKQEKKLAEKAQAWRVPASGAGRQKGDVRIGGIARIECKATQKKSFSITREMLDKIDSAAGATDEFPVIQVDFVDGKGNVTDSVAVVPMYILQRLIAKG